MTRSPGLIVSFLFLLIATQLMLAPAFVAGDDHPSVDVELDQDMEEVGNQPPIAVITHVFRSRVNFSESVVLRGMGVDNDGYIIQYRWWSDLDGNLSSASGEVVFDDLSVGEHVISFAVKDQLDNWSQPDQVNVTVMPRVVPSVTHIRHYPYYVKVGEGVRFYAYTTPPTHRSSDTSGTWKAMVSGTASPAPTTSTTATPPPDTTVPRSW